MLSHHRHTIGRYFAHDLVIGDFNNDSRPDVAAFCKYTHVELNIHLNPGKSDTTWRSVIIDQPEGEGLAAGDIDGNSDLDLVASRQWYENVNGDATEWVIHSITDNRGADCRDIIADMNGDVKLDVVLSTSEGDGGVSWFENPNWIEHKIEAGQLNGAHTLEVADFDQDGDLDVFTGEMHTSPQKRVLVYKNLGHEMWEQMILDTCGIPNGRIGDLDGDIDLVGKNYDGPKVLDVWDNMMIFTK